MRFVLHGSDTAVYRSLYFGHSHLNRSRTFTQHKFTSLSFYKQHTILCIMTTTLFVITLRYSQSCCVIYVWMMPVFYIDIRNRPYRNILLTPCVRHISDYFPFFTTIMRLSSHYKDFGLHTNTYFLRMMVCVDCYRIFQVLTLQPWWCQFLHRHPQLDLSAIRLTPCVRQINYSRRSSVFLDITRLLVFLPAIHF